MATDVGMRRSTPVRASTVVLGITLLVSACSSEETTPSARSTDDGGGPAAAASPDTGTGSGTLTVEPERPETAAPVTAEGGTVSDPSRSVRIDVPEGGVTSEVALTLSRVPADAWDDATAALAPVAVFDVEPDDAGLQAPVRISFRFPATDVGGSVSELVPLRQVADGSWELLTGVGSEVRDAEAVIAADTTALGRFAVVRVTVESARYSLSQESIDGSKARLTAAIQLTEHLFAPTTELRPDGAWTLGVTLGLVGGEPLEVAGVVDDRGVAQLDFGIDYFGTYQIERAELLAPDGRVLVLDVGTVEPVTITP